MKEYRKSKRLFFFFFAIRESVIHIVKKQCKLFQLFCFLSKPREVDTEHMFILNAFFCSGA